MATTRVVEETEPHVHYEREKVVEKSGNGTLIAVVVLILFVALLIYYGAPLVRSLGRAYNPGTQINVPNKIDVNVHNNPQQ